MPVAEHIAEAAKIVGVSDDLEAVGASSLSFQDVDYFRQRSFKRGLYPDGVRAGMGSRTDERHHHDGVSGPSHHQCVDSR
jgi:hypothetical protein